MINIAIIHSPSLKERNREFSVDRSFRGLHKFEPRRIFHGSVYCALNVEAGVVSHSQMHNAVPRVSHLPRAPPVETTPKLSDRATAYQRRDQAAN